MMGSADIQNQNRDGDQGASATPTGLSPSVEPASGLAGFTASIPSAWAGHRLCYVDGPWAYFTNVPLTEQWGDDWDDAPYEHNAEPPYERAPGQIVKIAWSGDFCTPDWNHTNSPWSVDDINSGATPWLNAGWFSHGDSIDAGATIAEFCAAIERHDGEVFFPAQWDRNPEGEDPQGLRAKHESPVGSEADDAPTPSDGDHHDN